MFGKLMKAALFLAGVMAFSNSLLKWALRGRTVNLVGGSDGPTAIFVTGVQKKFF